MFSEEAPSVFSVASRFVDGKNGLIFGSRRALAVDGSNFPDEGQAMADFVRGRGWEPSRLVLTHGHGDHILGAAPLAGGEVFAHALTPGVMREQIPAFARRWEASEAEAEARLAWPTVTFRGDLWMDLGDKRVRVFETPGHSVDGTSVYVEEDRLLFPGDTVVTGIVPAIGNGDSRAMEATLRRLMELEVEVLVPGHGRVLHGADRVQDWLRWQAGYLSGVRARVREALDGGKDAEAAADTADFETLIGNRLPADAHGMPGRHRATVMRIVEEERASIAGGRDEG